MGCGSSQAVSVVDSSNKPEIKSTTTEKERTVVSSFSERQEKTKVEVLTNSKKDVSQTFEDRPALEARKSGFMPLIPLNSSPSYQGTPFDSGKSSKADFGESGLELDKVSRGSSLFSDTDSGYLEKEYKNVITEKSDYQKVQKVEKEFKERNLEMGVNGKQCSPLLSDKEKEKLSLDEEQKAKELLKNNGLVQRPMTAKKSYATFDIVEERLMAQKPPKIRLPRILREKVNNKPSVTSDEIEKKLERASQRKKEKTQIKINKAQSSFSMDRRGSTSGSQSGFPISQEVIDRQKKLRDLRDHLKAKKENDDASNSARTPRTDALIGELEDFRPKTPKTAFKPEY